MKRRLRLMLLFISLLSISLFVMMTGCGKKESDSIGGQISGLSSDAEEEEDNKATDKAGYSILSEGSEAPDFTVDINDGSSFSLSEQEGKVILLNFWATWCGPCVREMPAFQKLYEEYGDEIAILAVDVAEDRSITDAFIEEQGYTFPIAYDEMGKVGSLYPTEGIPYTLVIGKDGKVKASFLGAEGADKQYDKYRNAVEEALSE